MYRSDGLVTSRCGSLATTGLPVADSAPLTTQLLLPGSLTDRRSDRRGPLHPAWRPPVRGQDRPAPAGRAGSRSAVSTAGRISGFGAPPPRVAAITSSPMMRHVESLRHLERVPGIRVAPPVGFLGAELRDTSRELQFGGGVGECRGAQEERLDRPRLGRDAGQHELDGQRCRDAVAMNAFTPLTNAVMIRRPSG